PVPSSGISRYRNSAPNFPNAKIFAAPFVYEGMVRPAPKNGVEQRSVCSETYPKLSQIGPLLPGTVGAPTRPLLGKRDGTDIRRAVPIIHGISAFHLYRIHQ